MNKEKKGEKKSWHKLNQSFGKIKQDLYFTLYQEELQCKKMKNRSSRWESSFITLEWKKL